MRALLQKIVSVGLQTPSTKQNNAAQPAALRPETVVFQSMSTDRALWRIARRGVNIGTVIDVGASNGMWSAVCERHFPEAHYLLIEAQKVHEKDLQVYCNARPKAEYVLAAAGEKEGKVYFDEGDPFGGLASTKPTEGGKSLLPATTVDVEIERRDLPGPYLVKLDTHGFEVPILNGASVTLSDTALAVIEAYNFQITDDSLQFAQMIEFMVRKQFRVCDMSEPLWRQKDMTLWQMDIFFQPSERKEFAYNAYV